VIYEYALTSPTGALTFNPATRRFDVSSIGAGLLTVCRSLSEETRYLPLQFNRLEFEESWGFTRLLRKLNQVEEEMGWLFKMEVKDGARGRNELEK
jgi:hypothetical protein